MINPEDIILEDISKMFSFEKISRDIDSIESIEDAKTMCKAFAKLYLCQQEAVSNLARI
jgi:hypothetical protein